MKKKKAVLTNGKLFLGIIIIFLIFIIIYVLFNSNKKNYNINKSDNNIIVENKLEEIEEIDEIEEENITENSQNIYQIEIDNEYVGSFEFSNIKISDNDGTTVIKADVKNTQGDKHMETPIYINLYDDNKNIIQVIEGTIPEINYSETKFLEIWANNVYYNASNIKIALDR